MFTKTKKNQIINLRRNIDKLDRQIIKLIAQRLNVVKKIGETKMRQKVKVFDKNREIEVLARVKKLAKVSEIDPRFIERIFKLIIKASKRIQNEK